MDGAIIHDVKGESLNLILTLLHAVQLLPVTSLLPQNNPGLASHQTNEVCKEKKKNHRHIAISNEFGSSERYKLKIKSI